MEPSLPYPVVKAEAVRMEPGRRVGLDVPGSALIESLGRDVLLVERFVRTDDSGERRMIVSALTILGLDEMMARYATYPDLAETIQAASPARGQRCVSCLPGSCSTVPSATPTTMPATTRRFSRDGSRDSRLQVCRAGAAEYLLGTAAARGTPNPSALE